MIRKGFPVHDHVLILNVLTIIDYCIVFSIVVGEVAIAQVRSSAMTFVFVAGPTEIKMIKVPFLVVILSFQLFLSSARFD